MQNIMGTPIWLAKKKMFHTQMMEHGTGMSHHQVSRAAKEVQLGDMEYIIDHNFLLSEDIIIEYIF